MALIQDYHDAIKVFYLSIGIGPDPSPVSGVDFYALKRACEAKKDNFIQEIVDGLEHCVRLREVLGGIFPDRGNPRENDGHQHWIELLRECLDHVRLHTQNYPEQLSSGQASVT